jgi:hypothetical protein
LLGLRLLLLQQLRLRQVLRLLRHGSSRAGGQQPGVGVEEVTEVIEAWLALHRLHRLLLLLLHLLLLLGWLHNGQALLTTLHLHLHLLLLRRQRQAQVTLDVKNLH